MPNFLWAIHNRHVDHGEGGEDVGRFVRQVPEAKRKTKEQQMRPYMCFRTRNLTIIMTFASYH